MWYKRFTQQMNIFVNKTAGNFGVSNLIVLDGFNLIFDLIGATNTYLVALEKLGLVRKVIDFAYNLNVQVHNDFFKYVPLYYNVACSIEATWLSGRIITGSVDSFHMTSAEYFEEWGSEPIKKQFSNFGIIHIHSNGRHLLEAVSKIKCLKAINFLNERDFHPAFSVLSKIKKITKFIPIVINVDMEDFQKGLKNHNLEGGGFYTGYLRFLIYILQIN